MTDTDNNTEVTSTTMIDDLIIKATERIAIDKLVVVNLKLLKKEVEKEQKKLVKNNKVKRTIKQNPQQVTVPMHEFVVKNFPDDQNADMMYTRQNLMRLLSNYIKEQKIQNEDNKKQWSGKEKSLRKIFNLKDDWYTFMQINGLLSYVIIKPPQ
jgi:hypothetical protein